MRLRIKDFKITQSHENIKNNKENKFNENDWNFEESSPPKQKSEKELVNINSQGSATSLKGLSCRICLESDTEIDNPLITPCKCSGTMKYIHFKCLQKWLKSKLSIKKNAIAITIMWKNISCELCHSQFPGIFL